MADPDPPADRDDANAPYVEGRGLMLEHAVVRAALRASGATRTRVADTLGRERTRRRARRDRDVT